MAENRRAFEDLPDIVEPAADDQTAQRDERLVFRTDHLRNYEELDDLIALEGKDYAPIKKAVWYSVLGTLKSQFMRFNNIVTDTRFHLFIPLPSGTGKNNLKHAITCILEKSEKEVRNPTSFHPEQLIGKIIPERFNNPDKTGKGLNDVRYISNFGYLHNDHVIFDEAYFFITEKDKQYEESKAYLRIALDPIGRNKIQKRLVDHLDTKEQRLEYYPRCTVTMFLQPEYMGDENIQSGFLRRFNVLYVSLVGKNLDRDEEIIRYVKDPRPNVSFDYWIEIAKWNRGVRNEDRCVDFTFDDGIDDLLIVLHSDLITYMRSLGEKQRNYLDRKAYAIFGDLIKMATIQAISRRDNVVTQQDVKLAYADLFEFFKLTLDYIAAKVHGNLDYGETWHGAEAKEIEALKWLVEHGAISADTSGVTINEWTKYLMDLFGVGEEAARKRHQKLKNKRKLIDSKQVGSNSSRVWITFDHDQEVFDDDPMPLEDTMYWQIANAPLPPLNNENNIKQLDGKGGRVVTGRDEKSKSVNSEGSGYHPTTHTTPPTNSDLDVPRVVKQSQQDRMKAIDRFFKDRNITYAAEEQLVKLVPEIVDELHISTGVAFRSVMQYGKDRGWV